MAISSPTNRSSILRFHAFTSSSVAVSPVPCENSPKSERHACMTSRSFATMNRPGLNSRSIIFNARIKSSLNRVARFDISVWKIRSRVRLLSVARSIHFCVWTAITGPASVATTTHHSIAISIHRYGMPRFAEGIICGHGALPLGTTRGHEVDSDGARPAHFFLWFLATFRRRPICSETPKPERAGLPRLKRNAPKPLAQRAMSATLGPRARK